MPHPEYPHAATADLPGVAFAPMRRMILAQAASGGLKVLEDAPGRLTVQTAHGLVGLRPGHGAETAGMVAARDARWLFVMKGAVIEEIRHAMPHLAEAMRWSDGAVTGSLPPNVQFVRVRAVEDLGMAFARVTLEGEDLGAYGDDAIHFRILIPPLDAEPEWPTVTANGSTAWPDGPGAPHRPVYTARTVDHGANTLLMDVFVHEGGRTTEWSREVRGGGRGRGVIGLVGPGGGGLIDAPRALMAADETGFPAAARLIEGLPEGATAEVILEAEHGADCGYPLPAREGVTVRWLVRARGEVLGAAALAALPRHADATIWFAGERADARRLREAAKAEGRPPGSLRISAFWSL